MMSSFSMRSGARARESRKRLGLSGWRALTCPNESTTPSCARMRLAVTISSSSMSRPGMDVSCVCPLRSSCPALCRASTSCFRFADEDVGGRGKPGRDGCGGSLQNKTHRAERAQLMRVDQHAALLDAEGVARAAQHISIFAHIFAHALVAAE